MTCLRYTINVVLWDNDLSLLLYCGIMTCLCYTINIVLWDNDLSLLYNK